MMKFRRDILDARLQSPEELSGLLNKALEGLRRVQRQRRFTEPESVKAAWRDFHATTDPLAVWLDRNTIDDPDAVVIKQVLRVAYNAAVERDGRPAMTAKAFGQAIFKLRPNIDGKQRIMAKTPMVVRRNRAGFQLGRFTGFTGFTGFTPYTYNSTHARG